MNARFGRVMAVGLGALGALLAWHPVFESDPYWHASLGREVLRQRTRVVEERSAHPAFADLCVVAEWLWDVAAYGAMSALGSTGLVALSMVVVGLAVGVFAAWLAAVARSSRGGAAGARPVEGALEALAVGLATLAVLAWRFEARPEVAGLLGLALVLWLREPLLDRFSSTRARVPALVAAVAVLGLWVQLHGSFVVGLAALGLLAVELTLRGDGPWAKGALLATGAALALSATGAWGANYFGYLLTHAGGDAKAHILDMQAPEAAAFSPFARSALGALTVLWTLAILGAARGAPRRIDVLTALVGVPLVLLAHRFAGLAAVLAAPLALAGIRVLTSGAGLRGRVVAAVLVAGAVALVLVAGASLHRARGPLLRAGETPHGHPTLAARLLATLPRGTNVLTDYRGGAELGLWLDGHVRTFVDGRTPMYFTDTDMALARDLATSPDKLARATTEFGFGAAVAERMGPLCKVLAATWTPVLVEGLYTTFLPPSAGATPVPGLLPCGPEYFPPDPCAGDGARAAAGAVTSRVGASPFGTFLGAAAEAYCGDPAAALRALPGDRDAWAIRDAVRVARTVALLRLGHADEASELLACTAARDPMLLLRVAANSGFESLPPATTRPVLEAIAGVMDDETLPWVRVKLARVCAASGDRACARFHATRAALAGDPAAAVLLAAP